MKVVNKDPQTFADVRKMILDTIVALQSDDLDISRGMAIAANFKVLNDNIFAEIGATKLALLTENKAHSFGSVVRMGQRLITQNAPVNENA